MTRMTRDGAVAAIRARLIEMVDEDHCMCQVAGGNGIYCHGFGRLTEDQLRQRYSWLLRIDASMDRKELENRANKWELARQIVHEVPIACDAQDMEKDTCSGWAGFDDETIARFYRDLVGEEIVIVSPPPS